MPPVQLSIVIDRADVSHVAGRAFDPTSRPGAPVSTIQVDLFKIIEGREPDLSNPLLTQNAVSAASGGVQTGAFQFTTSGKGLNVGDSVMVRAFVQSNRNSIGTRTTILAAAPSNPAPLAKIQSFCYQLRDLDDKAMAAIRTSGYELLVTDYSADGSDARAFTVDQVRYLKNSEDPTHSRIVLAYMSIGEAESYRFYWKKDWVTPDPEVTPDGPFTIAKTAPGFLHSSNPKWPNNFKVRFWDPVWQQVIISNPGNNPFIGSAKSYLDRIIDAGFDGVYLDIVDAYEFFGPTEDGGNAERPSAATDMMGFVGAIAHHARVTRGKRNFYVFPQNASRIIDTGTPAQVQAYMDAIDGIGAEDTFYYGELEENNALSVQTYALEGLRKFKEKGKVVLSIDYLSPSKPNSKKLSFPAAIDDFYRRARAEGFIPYATIRTLNVLTINPSQVPQRSSQ